MVAESIRWSEESTAYIRSRSKRYPGARDSEPAGTEEVLEDPELVAFEP